MDEEQAKLNRAVDIEVLIEAARAVSECHSCLSDGHADVKLEELKKAFDIYDEGRCPEVATQGPFGEEWCYPCHLAKRHDGWHRHEADDKILVTWE